MENTGTRAEAASGVDRWLKAAADFFDAHYWIVCALQLAMWSYAVLVVLDVHPALASNVRLPGEDISAQMEGAGTLLRFVDTAIFSWVARLLCGLCVGGAAWGLKEARFGSAVVAIVSALLFGTAPTWVRNIFSISGASSVFSQTAPVSPQAELVSAHRDTGEVRHG